MLSVRLWFQSERMAPFIAGVAVAMTVCCPNLTSRLGSKETSSAATHSLFSQIPWLPHLKPPKSVSLHFYSSPHHIISLYEIMFIISQMNIPTIRKPWRRSSLWVIFQGLRLQRPWSSHCITLSHFWAVDLEISLRAHSASSANNVIPSMAAAGLGGARNPIAHTSYGGFLTCPPSY